MDRIYESVQVRNTIIGEGCPKICVSVMGKDYDELIEKVTILKEETIDIVEWRLDFWDNLEDEYGLRRAVTTMREKLEDTPILATFRTKTEGGNRDITTSKYIYINKLLIDSGEMDLVDIELYSQGESAIELVKYSKNNGVKVVMSNHDFNKTPNKDDIVSRLVNMQNLGADICKIAVMPNNPKDVICLLEATYEMKSMYAKTPIITMSMSGIGGVTRLAGEIFGSAVTFAAVGDASAPGQYWIQNLKPVLEMIHNNL